MPLLCDCLFMNKNSCFLRRRPWKPPLSRRYFSSLCFASSSYNMKMNVLICEIQEKNVLRPVEGTDYLLLKALFLCFLGFFALCIIINWAIQFVLVCVQVDIHVIINPNSYVIRAGGVFAHVNSNKIVRNCQKAS